MRVYTHRNTVSIMKHSPLKEELNFIIIQFQEKVIRFFSFYTKYMHEVFPVPEFFPLQFYILILSHACIFIIWIHFYNIKRFSSFYFCHFICIWQKFMYLYSFTYIYHTIDAKSFVFGRTYILENVTIFLFKVYP